MTDLVRLLALPSIPLRPRGSRDIPAVAAIGTSKISGAQSGEPSSVTRAENLGPGGRKTEEAWCQYSSSVATHTRSTPDEAQSVGSRICMLLDRQPEVNRCSAGTLIECVLIPASLSSVGLTESFYIGGTSALQLWNFPACLFLHRVFSLKSSCADKGSIS